MRLWKRLFGGQKLEPAKRGRTSSLELPREFDGKMSYRDMFRTLSPERLRSMCGALPIESLDLERPVGPEMGRAITQVFAVSIYMATKEVPTEFGDIVFPRLISKIAEYDGSELHLELCDLVRDFAIYLASGGRHADAVRVMLILKQSLFWRVWSQADLCLFASLNNLALRSDRRSDFEAALDAAQSIPPSQAHEIGDAINNLRRKMEASS